jgi:hypothetical protein
MFMRDYHLEYIFSYTAHARLPPEIIGPVPDGIRAYVYVTGGEAYGPKVRERSRRFAQTKCWFEPMASRSSMCVAHCRRTTGR